MRILTCTQMIFHLMKTKCLYNEQLERSNLSDLIIEEGLEEGRKEGIKQERMVIVEKMF